ncbi:hypothetical protein C5E45_23125 [Nocardia nova]|uniref:Secreted protein n=1 Tax=Nocardia nova TaxID=37330 RepID=A0A2S6AL96_9NOCA|nr:hypothetical protein [Nocardia nova]PPJ31755.1 hypothetical protein C5E41_07665 [Nocardia nova]PPJ35994.1 hypothetical protein C5E45_23125 [Nocardia nova]
MNKRTIVSALLACAAAGGIATVNAGSASAETNIRSYSGYGAEQACNFDKARTPYRAGQEVVLCDRGNRGVYHLTVVPNAEIPLHLARLMVTGSFDGLS